jgi:hypothetical protein
MAEILAARFGPAAPEGWPRAPVAPPGIAATPSGDCAQRPHTEPAAAEPDAGGTLVRTDGLDGGLGSGLGREAHAFGTTTRG